MIDVAALCRGGVRRPEDFWPIEGPYRQGYQQCVDVGMEIAASSRLAVAMIARSGCPYIENTLRLVAELLDGPWRGTAFYAYENDSADRTPAVLAEFCAGRRNAETTSETLLLPDERGFEPSRTHRLAAARNRCVRWVADNAPESDYICVLDSDPHGGFSVAGVYNSIGWFREFQSAGATPVIGALASYSLYVARNDDQYSVAQYDAYAARLNWWENRGHTAWFHALLPPVGSRPIPMNSAFGGLCLYSGEAFRCLEYRGGDCEHVLAHAIMREHGFGLALNPGSRYVAILP